MSYYQDLMSRWTDLEAPASRETHGDLTFRDWRRLAERAAAWLHSLHVQEGQVVALRLPRGPLFLALHLGALRLGAGTLPLNPRYTDAEVEVILSDASPILCVGVPGGEIHRTIEEARAVLQGGATLPLPPAAAHDDSLALLCYTSGTTGRPKGARILHRHLRACVTALHDAWAWQPDDVLLHALPIFHIHGLVVAQHVAWWAGACTVRLPHFAPDATLAAIEEHRATVFMGVPTFYHRLLQSTLSPDLSSMRLFTSGSAPLKPQTLGAFKKRFGHTILERYGMTEIGIVLSNPYAGPRKPGSVGLPLPGTSVRVADPETDTSLPMGAVGEVQIQGPSVFDGYHLRPEASALALRGGWMHTGDLGYLDADGYVFLQGRRADLILVGGFNVYPPEVESALLDLPGIMQAAVVGIADDDLGEVPVAWIVCTSDASDDPAIVTALRSVLAPYKIPRAIRRVDELPRNSMGKIQKAKIRKHMMSTPS